MTLRGGTTAASATAFRLLFLTIGAMLPDSCLAYRPFDSTDADVASKGSVEIELGPVGYLAEEADRVLVAPALVANLGIIDRWEIVFEARHLVRLNPQESERRSRLESPGIFLKGLLREGSLRDSEGPSIATELGALLPATEEETGLGAQCAFILSQQWQSTTLHVNAAASWTRAHTLGLFGGVILEGPSRWILRPVAEVLVEGDRGSSNVASILAGMIWRVSEDLSLDFGFRRACAGSITVSEVRVGLTWAFRVRGEQ